jgi:hypothetical protein
MIALLFAAVAVEASGARNAGYYVAGSIRTSDGSWDYPEYDAVAHRIYFGRNYGVLALDLNRHEVLPTVALGNWTHKAVLINGGTELLSTNSGDDSLRFTRIADRALLARIPTERKPDGAAFDPVTGQVFVVNGRAGSISIVDPARRRIVGTIRTGTEMEAPIVDDTGRLFVAYADLNKVAIFDTRTRRQIRLIALPHCKSPAGVAYLKRTNVIVVACDNGVGLAIESSSGKMLASWPTGQEPDGVIVDEVRGRLFIPAGETGDLTIVDISRPGRFALLQRLTTERGARNGALDPRDGSLYLPTCHFPDGHPAGGVEPFTPGTCKILIVER